MKTIKHNCISIILFTLILFTLGSCSQSAMEGFEQSYSASASKTIDHFKNDISEGMSQKQIQIAFGSPQIQAKDEMDREVWIYEKPVHTNDSALLDDHSLPQLGEASDQTLSFNIKFDKQGRVRDWSDHISSF